MPDLKEALSRIGIKELSGMLGPQAISLLEKLDVRGLSAPRLSGLILKEFSPSFILLDAGRRLTLLSALKKSDAEQLANMLGVNVGNDPWEGLRMQTFSNKQKKARLLFEFFGCEIPVEDESKEIPAATNIECQYPLFDHQRDAVRAVSTMIRKSPGRVFLHMPTGSGKTRTAMNVIADFFRSQDEDGLIVWLAHSEELCDQAVEEFQKSWSVLGNRSLNIYRYYSNYDFVLSKAVSGFVVAGLSKLYKRSLSQMPAFLEMSQRVRLVIMDEAHQATAATYKHLLDLLAPTEKTAILGLSATPGRSFLNPGEDVKLARYFNYQKVSLRVKGFKTPVDYLQKKGYLAVPEFIKMAHTPSFLLSHEERKKIVEELDIPDEILNKLAQDERRNLLLLTRIMQEARTKCKIIVFACSVAHAKLLSNLLNLKGVECASVTSQTLTAHRSQIIKKFRESDHLNVLTNYGVLTTGFDAPRTSVAVIARPTKSVVLFSQMIGRVIRGPKVKGNKTCKIITVADQLMGFKSINDGFNFWEDIW